VSAAGGAEGDADRAAAGVRADHRADVADHDLTTPVRAHHLDEGVHIAAVGVQHGQVLQFAGLLQLQNEDFSRYPRDEVRDLAQLSAAGVDAVYLPNAHDMYPEGYQTYVDVERVTQPLEGSARPGHFRGVTTVVLKLFNAVGADRAYFGRKDAQQLRVVQRMVRDLDVGTEIVPCPIVREPDGLAMSSRNVYLSAEQRAAATVLKRSLDLVADRWAAGERDADALRRLVRDTIATEPLAEVDYVSLADDISLEELHGRAERPALLSLVVKFGKTRLLDNVELA